MPVLAEPLKLSYQLLRHKKQVSSYLVLKGTLQAEAEVVLCKKLGITVDQALILEYPGADNTLVSINKDDFWRRMLSAFSDEAASAEFVRLFAGALASGAGTTNQTVCTMFLPTEAAPAGTTQPTPGAGAIHTAGLVKGNSKFVVRTPSPSDQYRNRTHCPLSTARACFGACRFARRRRALSPSFPSCTL